MLTRPQAGGTMWIGGKAHAMRRRVRLESGRPDGRCGKVAEAIEVELGWASRSRRHLVLWLAGARYAERVERLAAILARRRDDARDPAGLLDWLLGTG